MTRMIGMASYNEDVDRFLASLRATGNTVAYTLIIDDLDACGCKRLEDTFGITTIPMVFGEGFWAKEPLGINRAQILIDTFFSKEPETIFLLCDVKDVRLQGKIPDFDLKPHQIILQQENKLFEDCKQNRIWANKPEGEWRKKPIMSAGGMVGRGKDMLELWKSIRVQTYGGLADQGEFNLFIWNHPEWLWTPMDSLWTAVNDDWGGLVNGKVVSKRGVIAPILHFCGTAKTRLRQIQDRMIP